MTLQEIVDKLIEIKKMGFVSTIRAHDGGVGNTLEWYLDVKENNLRLPDIGDIEIKAKRIDSSSMLTLASKSPLPRGVNKALFQAYSYVAEDNIRKLYTTIYGSRINSQGFKIILQGGDKLILDNKNKIAAYWPLEILLRDLVTKAGKILLVYAKTKGEKGSVNERFHYVEAYFLSGLSMEKFKKSIDDGKLKFDIRIGADKKGKNIGKYHDHGTAIRISKQDYLELYQEHRQLI